MAFMIYIYNDYKGGKNDIKTGVLQYLMNDYKPLKRRLNQFIKSVDLKN